MSAQVFRVLIITFGVWFLGLIINQIFPFFPTVINGFVLMYLFLRIGFIREETVRGMEGVFIPIIGIFFVPSAVNLYFLWDQVKDQFIGFVLYLIVSFFIVFFCSFFTAKILIKTFKIKG